MLSWSLVFLSLPIPCSLRYGSPVRNCPRLLSSEGSQRKLSWRSRGSEPAGHVTVQCMVPAGVPAFGVGALTLQSRTVMQGSEIGPQSFRLERDRPCGLELLWTWGYTTGVLASGDRHWARVIGPPQPLLLPCIFLQCWNPELCTCSAGAPLLSHSAALLSLILTE